MILNAEEVFLIGYVTTEDEQLERKLHTLFKKHRHHGEWFKGAPELRAYIGQVARYANFRGFKRWHRIKNEQTKHNAKS
jgi:hypothetical protein